MGSEFSPGLLDAVARGPASHASTESNTNILAVLGRNLRAARVSAGLTQQELAARAGIALTILAQIESGCGDPSLRLLGTLAEAVGCAAYDLLNL